MQSVTPSLRLPYLSSSQAQKHVTLNESLRMLDALVQLSVSSASAPLAEIAENGHRQIVAYGATGTGSGRDGEVAVFVDGAWEFHAPQEGWRAWVADEGRQILFDGVEWIEPPAGEQATKFGINATADETDRLAVSSASSLLNHAGTDHRLKINKAAQGDTASIVFQNGFSGRAEIGLSGDDAFRLKLSADGAGWTESIIADPQTGRVDFPAGLQSPPAAENMLLNGDFSINQRGFASGSLAQGQYGPDRWRGGPGGCSASLTSDGLTLNSGAIQQVIDARLAGASQVTMSFDTPDASGLAVQCLGQTASLQAHEGRWFATFTLPDPAPDLIDVTFTGSGLIRRVKLETGDWPTAWSPRLPALERIACTSYFEQIGPGSNAYAPFASGVIISSTQFSAFVTHLPKRAIPQVTFIGGFQILGLSIASQQIESLSAFSRTQTAFELRAVLTESRVAGQGGLLRADNDAGALIQLNAEI